MKHVAKRAKSNKCSVSKFCLDARPFCLSLLLVSQMTNAGNAQSMDSTYAGSQSQSGSFGGGASVSTGVLPPDSTIGALPLPGQAAISSDVLSAIGNTVTNIAGQTLVIDVGTQANSGTIAFAGSFNNAGNTYLVSSNPAITTAVLQAASIYNQSGALITTILPTGGLSGYSNLVSNLNLSLVATNIIANAGTISSAADLNIMAPQVINALPQGVAGPAPVMSALNNLNIISANIANSGVMSSLNNINIASQLANNILVNNVGGVLSAINGAINIRDAAFAEKYNFDLLGGNVLAQELNINTGDGILHLQTNELTPVLSVFAGEGYISALSDIHVATLQYSGDPILSSGGDIVFQGDQNPPNSGNYTTICTGSGTFSGNNAYIDPAHPCTLISTTGLVLNLSGFADLSGASISSSSGLSITAGSGISTGSISAPAGIILKTSTGNISAGTLSASSNFIQLQADSGSISTGSLSAQNAVMVVSGKSFNAPSVAVTGGGALDIYVNQATPFLIGGTGANVGSLSVTGTSPIGSESFIHVKNSSAGGITIGTTSAININTPFQGTYLALDASNGVLNLPAGVFSVDSNNFFIPAGVIALSASQINANGTTLSASNTAGGYAGAVVLGANQINTGNGLDIHADGIFGFAGLDGYGSVVITSTPTPPQDFLDVQFNGSQLYPIAIQGQSLTATADGYQGQVIFNGSTMTLGSSNVTLTANGTGYGSSGFVQLYANQINNTANVLATANGTGSDAGGFVYVRANAPTSDLTVGQGKLAVFANGGPAGGNGGEIDISAGRTLSVDTGSIGSAALGGNGWGGRVTLVGGTQGLAGGGVVFTNQNASINANGQGSGDGGLVQIGAFGNGSNLTLPSISANGGATGAGGWIDSTANGKLIISGPLAANGGSNGSGGTVNLTAGLNSPGTINSNSTISANGTGTAQGGTIALTANGTTADITVGDSIGQDFLEANGARGGSIYLAAGKTLNVKAPVRALGSSGSGGFIQLDSGYEAVGDINIDSSVIADRLAGTGTDGQVYVTSYNGNVKVGSTTANGHVSANGGTTVSIRSGLNSAIAAGSVVSADAVGTANSAGTVKITAGTVAPGTIDMAGSVHANATGGNGGSITLSQSNSSLPMLITGTVAANSTSGQGGEIFLENYRGQALNVRLNGTISATGSNSLSMGNLNIRTPGQAASIDGSGRIDARILANASQVNVSTDRTGADVVLRPFDVQATGNVSFVASGTDSSISLLDGATVNSGGTLVLKAPKLNLGSGSRANVPSLHGNNVELRTTSTGTVSLLSNISATNELLIFPEMGGSIEQPRDESGPIASISAGNTTLQTVSGTIGFANERIDLTTGSLTLFNFSTDGNAYLDVRSLQSQVSLRTVSVTGELIIDAKQGELRVDGVMQAGNLTLRSSGSGDIVLANSITATNSQGARLVTTSASIRQANALTNLSGPLVRLESAGSIDANTAANQQLQVIAPNGGASVRQSGTTMVTDSNVKDGFDLTVSNGSLLNDAFNQSSIKSGSLAITVTNGNVGESIGVSSIPVNVAVNELSVQAPLGAAFINNTKNTTLTLSNSQSKLDFVVRTAGSLTTTGGVRSEAGGVELVAGAGNLVVTGIPFLIAGDGNLVLQNKNSSGIIDIGFGARLSATGSDSSRGNVYLFLGASPTQVQGEPPANFVAAEVNGGQIFWGNNVVKPGDPNTEQPNVLGADARAITFSGPDTQNVIFHGDALVIAQGASSSGDGSPPGHGGGDPPGQVRPNPGQTGQTPGQSGGTSGPPGQQLFNPPGQINNPSNPSPPGQSKEPKGQQKKASANAESEFKSVAYYSLIPTVQSIPGLQLTETPKCSIRTIMESDVRATPSGDVRILHGEVMLLTNSLTKILTEHASLFVSPDTLVLVKVSEEGLVIQVLRDRHAHSVTIELNDGNRMLAPMGSEVCLSSSYDVASVLDETLSRRNHRVLPGSNFTISLAELSPVSVLLENRLAKQWLRTPLQRDAHVKRDLFKSIAALSLVTNRHGGYKQKE